MKRRDKQKKQKRRKRSNKCGESVERYNQRGEMYKMKDVEKNNRSMTMKRRRRGYMKRER